MSNLINHLTWNIYKHFKLIHSKLWGLYIPNDSYDSFNTLLFLLLNFLELFGFMYLIKNKFKVFMFLRIFLAWLHVPKKKVTHIDVTFKVSTCWDFYQNFILNKIFVSTKRKCKMKKLEVFNKILNQYGLSGSNQNLRKREWNKYYSINTLYINLSWQDQYTLQHIESTIDTTTFNHVMMH